MPQTLHIAPPLRRRNTILPGRPHPAGGPVWLALTPGQAAGAGSASPQGPAPVLFATFAESLRQLAHARLLAMSIREFGGMYKQAPIRLYVPPELAAEAADTLRGLPRPGGPAGASLDAPLGVETRTCTAPEDALGFFYAAKVFAAARAERDAEGDAEILVWLDEDTIVLQEPGEFALPAGKQLGYRPVMHKNVGLLYNEPLDAYWGRVFELLRVDSATVFPVVTPADGDTLRTYVNAGCLAVRPQRGLLREWAECFAALYADASLTAMCKQDEKRRVFLHQVALTGAILTHLRRDELLELSDRINYPIFFQSMFGAKREFNDIRGVVTFRHESYFSRPDPDWQSRLEGPPERVAWIRDHLIGES